MNYATMYGPRMATATNNFTRSDDVSDYTTEPANRDTVPETWVTEAELRAAQKWVDQLPYAKRLDRLLGK
jgi:hypothetical protein